MRSGFPQSTGGTYTTLGTEANTAAYSGTLTAPPSGLPTQFKFTGGHIWTDLANSGIIKARLVYVPYSASPEFEYLMANYDKILNISGVMTPGLPFIAPRAIGSAIKLFVTTATASILLRWWANYEDVR